MVNKTVWEWQNLKSLWNSLTFLDEEHNRLFAGIIRLCTPTPESFHKTWSPIQLPLVVETCPATCTPIPECFKKTRLPPQLPPGTVTSPATCTTIPEGFHKNWSPPQPPPFPPLLILWGIAAAYMHKQFKSKKLNCTKHKNSRSANFPVCKNKYIKKKKPFSNFFLAKSLLTQKQIYTKKETHFQFQVF